jgi:hypothetical protein
MGTLEVALKAPAKMLSISADMTAVNAPIRGRFN